MYYCCYWLQFYFIRYILLINFCIAEKQRDLIHLLATVTSSPGSGWIEPILETNTEDLFKHSIQSLTGQQQPFMHLEFQVKIII